MVRDDERTVMPNALLHNQTDLDRAAAALVKADPRLAPLVERSGPLALRRHDAGFSGLCRIVTGQQLSTHAAAAIWGRLAAAYDPFDPDRVRRARAATLGKLGLSAAKIKTVKALGLAVSRGELDLGALADMEADAAHRALVAIHGIGPWTADLYLLFCLGHADAFPAGDLALQESARLGFALDARPTAKELAAMAEMWRPWRGVAAHLLWAYYRVIKQRDPVPIQPDNGDS